MQNEKIHLERIKRFIARLKEMIYTPIAELTAEYVYSEEPIPLSSLENAKWKTVAKGEKWGFAWGSAFFKVEGILSTDKPFSQQGLKFDCDGEACVFKDNSPWQGLTPKVDWYHNAAKHYVPLQSFAASDGKFSLLIEAAANKLFGSVEEDYFLRECSLVAFNEELYQFVMDLEVLNDLVVALPNGSVRRAKLIYGLNEICNLYSAQPDTARNIAKKLLDKPAEASALTAYSVGHAHLDLAWLWRTKESKRKGGRTFANALRLLETYPEYVFGASQAQLYKWIRQLYPQLYSEVKEAISQGRWEVQGASWVEFDTNLISGESIIRQLMYGSEYFKQEFGHVAPCLWLPDCFGFSGNLPQFLKGCGVEYFITQKLSWNETNTFDKHLFVWQGIDGSEVLAHQLPTNDYNFSNNPSSFKQTEARFAQAEITDGFLNLYGIGDGGGGPTRNHIEYGLRLQDTEGNCKFRFAKASEFLEYFATLPKEKIPKAYGELYLEFHRGTYTTQAKMKQMNAKNQQYLKAIEALCVLKSLAYNAPVQYPALLKPWWEDTMLLQFHDILPGSSIGPVYEDATLMCAKNHSDMEIHIGETLGEIPEDRHYTLFNPSAAQNNKWLSFPIELKDYAAFLDGCEMDSRYEKDGQLYLYVEMEAWSIGHLIFRPEFSLMDYQLTPIPETDAGYILQGAYLKVLVSKTGQILSIVDDNEEWEYLAEPSNNIQAWEDEPNNWGAWDINHFYKETVPLQASEVKLVELSTYPSIKRIVQDISIGKSTIRQTIELKHSSRMINIKHEVDWQEHHRLLRVSFTPDLHCQTANCGIQMANIQRSTRPQNAFEAAKFEFPAQGYVALSEGKRSFAILCPDKYGYSLNENRIGLSLLRSPADVDKNADIGFQQYSYSILCAPLAFADSEIPFLSEALATPLYCAKGNSKIQENPLWLLKKNLVLSAIKPAEKGNAIILRCYEPYGKSTVEAFGTLYPTRGIYLCNMLEEPVQEVMMYHDFAVKPFEIITLRVELS